MRSGQSANEFLSVQRAANSQTSSIQYVSVDHGRGHMFVSEKFLNRPDIVRWIASLIAVGSLR